MEKPMRYNDFRFAPVAQWIERLTSNWTGELKILSMGLKSVHPLDGVDQDQSIKRTKSTLSTLIAPQLHQNKTTRVAGLAARFQLN